MSWDGRPAWRSHASFVVIVALALSSCTSDPAPTPSVSADATNTPSGPSETASPQLPQPPPPGSGLRAMLLRGREIPGLNEHHRWRATRTVHGEPRRPIWACQVADFVSIGATDVWSRGFAGVPGGATAQSAVVSFVDTTSAKRAYAVLQAWHDRCADRLERGHRRVSVDRSVTTVDVAGGTAEWRLAVYGPVRGNNELSYLDATGFVRKGKRLVLTTLLSVGQDYDYPPGAEPIVGAVRVSAARVRG